MTFLSNPVVVVVLVALILGGGLFVVSRWGKLGSGTGGVTGGPAPKPDPTGNKKPGGYKPPTPPTGDGTA
jgi:hypothetical protein